MFDALLKSPVLQTSSQRIIAVYTSLLKANKITYTVKLTDLNSHGGLNDAVFVSPNKVYKEMQTIYVSHKNEKQALHLLGIAKNEAEKED